MERLRHAIEGLLKIILVSCLIGPPIFGIGAEVIMAIVKPGHGFNINHVVIDIGYGYISAIGLAALTVTTWIYLRLNKILFRVNEELQADPMVHELDDNDRDV